MSEASVPVMTQESLQTERQRPVLGRAFIAGAALAGSVLGLLGHNKAAAGEEDRLPAGSDTILTIADPLTPESNNLNTQAIGEGDTGDYIPDFECDQPAARSVVLNVVATEPSAAGYLQVYTDAAERGRNSNVNYAPGQTVSNLVFARATPDEGQARLFTLAETHAVVDKQGTFALDAVCDRPDVRKIDTRGADMANPEPMPAAGSFIEVRGEPYTTAAVNLTAVNATGPGFLQLLNDPSRAREYSNLNYNAGDTVPVATLINYDKDGKAYIYSPFGNTHILLDENLIFNPSSIIPVNERILDTRKAEYGGAKIQGGQSVVIRGLPGRTGIVSLVVTENTQAMYLQAVPEGQQPGQTSNVNVDGPNKTRNALAFVKFNDAGEALLYVSHGEAHVVADLLAYTVDGENGNAFIDTPDERLMDTREDDSEPDPDPGQEGIEVISQSGPDPINIEQINAFCEYIDYGMVAERKHKFLIDGLSPGGTYYLEWMTRTANGVEYVSRLNMVANDEGVVSAVEGMAEESQAANRLQIDSLTLVKDRGTAQEAVTTVSVNIDCSQVSQFTI